MKESVEDKLKEELEGWLLSIKIRRESYVKAREHVKLKERELKEAKYIFGQTYKNWKEARKEALRAKRRVYSVPYRMRKWAENNFGKAWELIERDIDG